MNWIKKIFLSLTFLLFGLLIAEIGLHLMNHEPGILYKTMWFHKVDTLKNLSGYIADEHGIFRMDTSLTYIFDNENYNDADAYQLELEKNGIIGSYAALVKDFNHLRNGKVDCSLYATYLEIQKKEKRSDLDSAILNYIYQPINDDGFFSIPFKQYNSEQPKVLLIGDSFTWGHTTSNKALSFANELLAAGYVVYNTGISGTDPAQYEAVAKKYIPLLQPDIVIVNFFLGNDINYWDRDVSPYQPVFFPTNAGNLMAFQQGHYFNNPQDAYDNILKNLHVPSDTWVQKLASKTNITTLMWYAWFKLGMTTMPHQDFIPKNATPSCNVEIAAIQKICEQNQVDFKLMVIPDYKYGILDVEKQAYLFEDLDYTYSQVPKSNYNLGDGHFNDEGHQQYFQQITRIINE